MNEMILPKSLRKRIVIVGAGFAGVSLCKGLFRSNYQIVLIDRNNYHTFQPLLYQVATGGIEADSVARPIRGVLKVGEHLLFRRCSITALDTETNSIETTAGRLNYDYLVLASGAKTNYFGKEGAIKHSIDLKGVPQALFLRSKILKNFEEAALFDHKRDPLYTNYVIVGGGPTGVEVAGALAELRQSVLPKDFPELDFSIMQIFLIEASGTLLASMSTYAHKVAKEYLDDAGIVVMLNTRVRDVQPGAVILEDGNTIVANTVIWSAGVIGNLPIGIPQNAINRGRVAVDEFCKVRGLENVYAVGDVAIMQTNANPKGNPMLSPVAIASGQALARNFIRMEKERKTLPFSYTSRGVMAVVGRNKAIVELSSLLVYRGFPAWITWMAVHLAKLPGTKNKIVVFINWLLSYPQMGKSNRFIIDEDYTPRTED